MKIITQQQWAKQKQILTSAMLPLNTTGQWTVTVPPLLPMAPPDLGIVEAARGDSQQENAGVGRTYPVQVYSISRTCSIVEKCAALDGEGAIDIEFNSSSIVLLKHANS
jgi:hypothetical protein